MNKIHPITEYSSSNRQQMEEINRLFFEDSSDEEDEEDEGSETDQLDYNKVKITPHNSVALTPMNQLKLAYIYSDKYPFLKLRKLALIQFYKCRQALLFLINTSQFQLILIIVILTHSILRVLQITQLKYIFLSIYTVEFILKVIAQGLIFKKNAYFKDLWNILDFIILLIQLISLDYDLQINLSSLRTLRVLKALMAVDRVKPLHVILMSLFESISQLKNAVIVLLFSYSIFAIVGLIIFSGLLKYRCITESEGIHFNGEVCGTCSVGFICGKTMENPNFGLINFDTFLQSLLQVFITTTMEGWSTIMFKVMQALNFGVVVYFIGIVLFGGFFLVNLTLAIIKLSFTNANLPTQVVVEDNIYNYWQLRNLQIYEPIRPLCQQMYGCTFDKEKQKQKLSLFDSRLKRKTLTIAVKKRMSIFLGKNAKTPALRRSSATKSKSILKQRFSVKFDESTIIRDFPIQRQESKSEQVITSPSNERSGLLQQQFQTIQMRKPSIKLSLKLPQIKDLGRVKSISKLQVVKEENLEEQENQDHFAENQENKELQLNSEIRNAMKLLTKDSKNSIELQDPSEMNGTHSNFQSNLSIKFEGEINSLEQKKIKRKRKRFKSFQIVNSKVDQQEQQLKNKLFMTRFSVVVKMDPYISTSQNDVQIHNIKAKKQQQERDQEFQLKKKNVKVKYLDEEITDKNIQYVPPKLSIYQSQTVKKLMKQSKNKSLTYQRAKHKMNKQFKQPFREEIEMKLDESEIGHITYDQINIRKSIYYQEYQTIIKDQLGQKILEITSSIEDVLQINYFDQRQRNILLLALNRQDRDIWMAGLGGIFTVLGKNIESLVQSNLFLRSINFCVAFNTIILALDGLVSNDDLLQQFNMAFTAIFTIELTFKVAGYGVLKYLKDKMNIFDAIIVAISLYEISVIDVNGKSSFSVLRSIRIFRALRVLRIQKLIRSLQFMGFLMKVLSNAFDQIIYLFFLMLFFQYIFTLLGFDLFFAQLQTDRINFNSFIGSYEIVFQVFTLSNWNNVLYSLLQAQIPNFITVSYFVIWISLGNYIFLNLFLAVLLDNFEAEYRKDKKQIDNDIIIAKDQFNNQNSDVNKRSYRNSIQMLQSETVQSGIPRFVYFSEPGLAEYSLLIFSQENPIRIICYRIAKDAKFELCILLLILISSVKLIIDTYDQDIAELYGADEIDLILAILFSVEAVLKIISFGFIVDPNSYLRDSWNSLDFFILIVSIIDVSLIQVDLGFLKILRLFRTLRPLRFITHYSSMKILVSALLQSVEGIFNVGIVIILTWMMFAIIGINFTKGKMNYCNMGDGVTYYVTQENCLGSWEVRDTNFENIFTGMLTLFILSTLVAWPDYLLYFKDGSENGPVLNYNPEMFWFFAAFILIGSILLINLFIGVILVNFHIAEEKSRDPTLTMEQVFWMDTQKLILNTKPNFHLFYSPKNRIGQIVFSIIKFKYFENLVVLIILSNVLVIALYSDDGSQNYLNILDILNFIFTIFFIIEAGMKIIAFSVMGYFRNYWNQFDFVIVVISILDLSLNNFNAIIAKIFRVLRVSRLLRLVNQFNGLKKVVDTAIFSIPAIANAAILYFLFHSIFSILAVFLFKEIKNGAVLDEFVNFENFHHSFVILFRSQTGEDWYKVMFDTIHEGSVYYALFWIVFIVIQKFIMLNLFILIILDQYDMNYFHEDNPLNRFEENKTKFLVAWTKFSPNGDYIYSKDLMELMLLLQEPLGFDINSLIKRVVAEWKSINPNHTQEAVITLKQRVKADCIRTGALKIMNMQLLEDEQGRIGFYQAFFAIFRESVLIKIVDNLQQSGAKKIAKKEQQIKQQLDNLSKIVGLAQYNPTTQYLYKQLCFRALLRFSQLQQIIKEEIHNFQEASSPTSHRRSLQYDEF